jgi:hypothetical protein
MIPIFTSISNKLSRAKILLIATLAITVFSFICSVVLGFSYFAVKKNIYKIQIQNISQLQKLDQLKSELVDWQRITENQSFKGLSPETIEKIVLSRLDSWQNIVSLSKSVVFNDPVMAGVFKEIRPSFTKSDNINWSPFFSQIESGKKTLYNDLTEAMQSLDTIHKEFIIIGLVVLIFGILIPFFIFRFVHSVLQNLRKEIERTAYDFVKTWSAEKAKMGNEAFKNIEFWLKIGLTFGTHSGRMSRHPIAQMLGEISYIVNTELARLEAESQTEPKTPKSAKKTGPQAL